MIAGVAIRVKGKVQGVGFRPAVWQIAHQMVLCGDVSNDSEGVLVHLLKDADITGFIDRLQAQCPPLARIDSIEQHDYTFVQHPAAFVISASGRGEMDTEIIPDAATCDACRAELFDPLNRRYRYPFINCTHCGPRFTIIRSMPYDRPNTAMSVFPFCPVCQKEYEDPGDRRFHAQPNACPDCGPQIWLTDADQQVLLRHDDAIAESVRQLHNGNILAMQGLGGFHLAVDAGNSDAVAKLRVRKHRPAKPFAVMIPSVDWLTACLGREPDAALVTLLKSPAAPIVLIEDPRLFAALSPLIAPNLCEIGIMLPSNPLQHLLLNDSQRPLVMTSGNASGHTPALDHITAFEQLDTIADVFLLHNREIIQRADDSLVRYQKDGNQMLRRARGYVPDTIDISMVTGKETPSVLALGGDLKNAFCFLHHHQLITGPHLGDLDDLSVQAQQEASLALFQQIYQVRPQAVAADAHPGYVSHQTGMALAKAWQVPFIPVYHHHAHIAACLAEHGWRQEDGPVVGIALDGLGFGADNQLWGGEVLAGDYLNMIRTGGLPAVSLPGGDRAATQPWRNLLAHLHHAGLWPGSPLSARLPEQGCELLIKAIEQGINSPRVSSCGRLFDAVACALGLISGLVSWEGEAACALETHALQCHNVNKVNITESLPVNPDNTVNLFPLWLMIADDSLTSAEKAFRFHVMLANTFAELADEAAKQYQTNTVVLSGGVFNNRLLRGFIKTGLTHRHVLEPRQLPCGDGGIAAGQAVIAALSGFGAC